MIYDSRESDSPIVSETPPNKEIAAAFLAEEVERRGQAKGNVVKQPKVRAQHRVALQHALDRIRQFIGKGRDVKLTTLWHHVYDVDGLRESYYSVSKTAAAGIDGKTWVEYGDGLDENLQDLSARLKCGSYRAKAVKRLYIPKSDGRRRPIGIPVLEDKIVQRSVVAVLNTVYEHDFKGFSYGFRPGRSQHTALDALTVAIESRKVNWVLDADIRGFFDTIAHEWLLKFVEHRIADDRVFRHILKWLKAGVMEEGRKYRVDEGTPQGGSISPLLANIYLHYVLDLWADWWRRKQGRGEMIIVRYADDFIIGFQYRDDAEKFLEMLKERLGQFNLELHPEKTRLLEFGRFAASNRQERGQGKPETFDFLGFTHICSHTRKGRFAVRRQTIAKRLRSKLRDIKQELRKRLNDRVSQTGAWLRRVLSGYYRYHAVPRNIRALKGFRDDVIRLWYRMIKRRSHKHRLTWQRMFRLAKRWLPNPRIQHPYPCQRLRVTT